MDLGKRGNQNFTLIIGTPIPFPEPASAGLVVTALAGLLLAGRVRHRRPEA